VRLLGFDFFLSRGLYGARPPGHRAAYRAEPRWYFVELGDYTLEVTVPKLSFNRKATKAPSAPWVPSKEV
jgi:hypothetical protein